ncbi:putative zinc ribbon domain protein [Posidoniimonas polymericola]|uniref:Putative zinc ribbon domain protein n=1 Tax=Posidoniimonas polymericola TaxID=2528002 RepID=A0A5C5YKL5_9BACT|nr:phospholipase [Posidoniimonas polymericola]TWT75453.1 putative zinc ribbon domain protein [Posidoniimonas polymericola]
MSTTTVPAETLQELHRLLEQLADLSGRLERGPKQIQAHKASVAKLEAAAAAAHELVKQTRMAADAKQLDLRSCEDRIGNWKVKLNECSSNKEYHALTEQIAAAEMANSVMEDEILEALGRVDTLVEAAGQADANLEQGKQELARVTKHVEDSADSIRAEITRIEGERVAAEKKLPGDFRAEYSRVIKSKGASGMSAVENKTCTGCGNQVTLNMQNTLAMSRPAFCQSCGAVLYLAD